MASSFAVDWALFYRVLRAGRRFRRNVLLLLLLSLRYLLQARRAVRRTVANTSHTEAMQMRVSLLNYSLLLQWCSVTANTVCFISPFVIDQTRVPAECEKDFTLTVFVDNVADMTKSLSGRAKTCSIIGIIRQRHGAGRASAPLCTAALHWALLSLHKPAAMLN